MAHGEDRFILKPAAAIVVGGGLNALGVVRSLGQAGVGVHVLDTDPKSPAMRSRYGQARLVPAIEGAELMRALRQMPSELGPKLVLYLTEEKTVTTVSEHRGDLPPSVRIRFPDHHRLMALMHKQQFYDLAQSILAPVPRTVRLQELADLPLVAGLSFPCVLKPNGKSYEYGARFKKAYKVASPEEVTTLYREIHPVLADMVVQEWIEGRDSDIYFCLQYIGQDGKLVASFPGRKIRSWPPNIGGTASCTAAWEHHAELSALTSGFFRQVGFSGMGSMEYKRDARDGRFYMVEPTVGRTDFQEEVATVNGVNIPYAAYCYELGLSAPFVQPSSPPKTWSESRIDKWSMELTEKPNTSVEVEQAVVDAIWRWNDPIPWLDSVLMRLRHALHY